MDGPGFPTRVPMLIRPGLRSTVLPNHWILVSMLTCSLWRKVWGGVQLPVRSANGIRFSVSVCLLIDSTFYLLPVALSQLAAVCVVLETETPAHAFWIQCLYSPSLTRGRRDFC